MARFIGFRIISAIPVLLLASIFVFVLVSLKPGDPALAIAGTDATPQQLEEIRERHNLNDPLPVQYLAWLGDVVRLDLGESFGGESISGEISRRLPVTLSLVAGATVFAVALGVPAALISTIRAGRPVDWVVRVISGLGLAIPSFVLGIVLIVVFTVRLRWLPYLNFARLEDSPFGWLESALLPCISLGLILAAVIMRHLRASLLEVLDSSYIRAAWARGGSRRSVIGRSGLRNAVMPVITVLGTQSAALLGGSVIVEQVFSIPGLGPYALQATLAGDMRTIQGLAVVYGFTQVVMSLLIDISYGFINPRLRVA